MKNILSILVSITGIACIVFGILFIMQAGSSKAEIAEEIQPLAISQVDGTYDQVSAALKAATEPAQVQQLTMQKTSLGLAKSNIGVVEFVKNSGIVTIVIGSGLLLTGFITFGRE